MLILKQSKPSKLDLSHKLTVTRSNNGLIDEINRELSILKDGAQLLVIVPDERDLAILLSENLLTAPTVLTTEISKSERYLNYLTARFEPSPLILGTRSAIFTPLVAGSKIMIYNDNDESMYERRNPGWNVRDIALLRSGDQYPLSIQF